MRVNSNFRTVLGGIGLLTLVACGQTVAKSGSTGVDTNPIDAETPSPTATPSPTGTPNPSATPSPYPTATPVPTAFGDLIGKRSFAVVVNKTMAALGVENGNHYAQIRTQNGISSPGAYYGVGYGNKGFIGFGLPYHGVPVSQFESLSFRTFEPTSNRASAYNVYVNLLVDLNCDPLKPDYTVVLTPNLGGNQRSVWNRYVIKKTDAMFRTPGGKGGLPDSQTRSSPAPLTQLIKAKPNACFVAADVFGVGMKRNQKMAPFQLVHGDSIYTQASVVRIDDIELRMTNSTFSEDFE